MCWFHHGRLWAVYLVSAKLWINFGWTWVILPLYLAIVAITYYIYIYTHTYIYIYIYKSYIVYIYIYIYIMGSVIHTAGCSSSCKWVYDIYFFTIDHSKKGPPDPNVWLAPRRSWSLRISSCSSSAWNWESVSVPSVGGDVGAMLGPWGCATGWSLLASNIWDVHPDLVQLF